MQVVDSLKSPTSPTDNSRYVSLIDFIHELSGEDREAIVRHMSYIDFDANSIMVRKELLEVAKILKVNNPRSARRMANSLFNDRDTEFFMNYVHKFRRYVKNLVIAPHYMQIQLGGKFGRWEINRKYIVGLNDFKDTLFINEVDTYVHGLDVYVDHKFRYFYTDDNSFREAFGYETDVLGSATLGLGSNEVLRSFRVSGEVVFQVWAVDVDYYTERLFKPHVHRYIAYLAADYIARIMLDNGFNIPMSPGFRETYPATVRIIVPGALTRTADFEKVTVAFKRMLKDYFTVEPTNADPIIVSTEDFKVEIILRSDYRYGAPRGDLLIDISMPFDPDAESRKYYVEIMSDVKKNVRELIDTEQEHTIYVGNHLIKLVNALPINFTYEARIKPEFYPPINLTVYQPMEYFVTPKTKVHIEHLEHGARELSFDNTYVLNIRTTNVSNEHIEKRNVLALRRLINQYT